MNPWRQRLEAAIPFLTVWVLLFVLMALGTTVEGRHRIPTLTHPISHVAHPAPQGPVGMTRVSVPD